MTQKQKRFRILKQGYDRFEVDRVLYELEQSLHFSQEKLGVYQNQIQQTQQQLKQQQEKYAQLSQAIKIREKAADEINRLALKEANRVIETATSNADGIIQEALLQAKTILLEVSQLALKTQVAKQDMITKVAEITRLIDEFKLPEVPNPDWLMAQELEIEESND